MTKHSNETTDSTSPTQKEEGTRTTADEAIQRFRRAIIAYHGESHRDFEDTQSRAVAMGEAEGVLYELLESLPTLPPDQPEPAELVKLLDEYRYAIMAEEQGNWQKDVALYEESGPRRHTARRNLVALYEKQRAEIEGLKAFIRTAFEDFQQAHDEIASLRSRLQQESPRKEASGGDVIRMGEALMDSLNEFEYLVRECPDMEEVADGRGRVIRAAAAQLQQESLTKQEVEGILRRESDPGDLSAAEIAAAQSGIAKLRHIAVTPDTQRD